MTDPAMTSLVDVSQADRDLVASLIEQLGEADEFECAEIRQGMADATSAVQQAARHRLTAEQAKDAEIERAWEAYRIASTTDLEKRVAVLEEALIKISRAVRSNRLVSHKLAKIDETCRAALNDTHSEEHTR